MPKDEYDQDSSGYSVRSLYFDSYDDECLHEKLSGISQRSKYRLRIYNGEESLVKLEVKSKNNFMIHKKSIVIDYECANAMIRGDYRKLANINSPLANEIYCKFSRGLYKPKVIVEYRRVAFTHPISNFRVTFDLDAKTALSETNLFKKNLNFFPILRENKQILEIKYNEIIPSFAKCLLSGVAGERSAISKYTLARRFNKIQKFEDN